MANIVITGASGAFGQLAVTALLKEGHKVVATLRDIAGRNQAVAEQLQQQGALVVELDVTDDASVASGTERAIALLGQIDVLINNAGVGVNGVQEAFTVADIQRIFDINLYGVHRMVRAITPHFRTFGQGLIMNISSLLGRITIPFYGPYNASKWALEALTENYRIELSQFGIDVVLVEPGGFPTTFIDNSLKPSDQARLQQLGDFAAAPAQALAAFEDTLANNPQQDPNLVAEAIANVIATPAGSRAFRTTVDKLGMGEPIQSYNQQAEAISQGILNAFGAGEMLQLKRA